MFLQWVEKAEKLYKLYQHRRKKAVQEWVKLYRECKTDDPVENKLLKEMVLEGIREESEQYYKLYKTSCGVYNL